LGWGWGYHITKNRKIDIVLSKVGYVANRSGHMGGRELANCLGYMGGRELANHSGHRGERELANHSGHYREKGVS